MPYGSISRPSARIFSSSGTRPPPYSNPAPIVSSQSIDEASEGRSGNNSPYIKGGVLTTVITTVKSYRAIVGHQMVPVRHKVYYRDSRGRRIYKYVIRHKRKNVWGIKTRLVRKTIRVKSPDPGLLLMPNNLTYNASYMKERGGESIFVRDKGQPYQLTIKARQTGAISGPLSGDFSLLGPTTDPFATPPDMSARFEQLKRKSLSRLYSKVQDEKANLALLTAESKKTFGLVSDIFFSGLRLARSLYRLDARSAVKVIGASRQQLSSRWLAYVYGVAPLISEVNKIASDLGGSVKDFRKYQTVSSETLDLSSSSLPPLTGVSTSQRITLGCKTAVILNTKFSIPKASVQYGFSQPAALVWELIPFSFVADWFVPIGNWLTSSHALDIGVLSYYETYFQKTETSYSSYHFINDIYGLQGGGSGPSGEKTLVYVSRQVKSPPAMPLPSLSHSPFSPLRIANALALLNQRY